MSRDDPKAQAWLAAYRDEHAMSSEHGAGVWARIERSIVDGTARRGSAGQADASRADESHADAPRSGAPRSLRVGWLLALAVAAGAVLALSVTVPLALRDEPQRSWSESLDQSGGHAPGDVTGSEHAPAALPNEAEPPPAEPPAELAAELAAQPAEMTHDTSSATTSEPARSGARARRPASHPARAVDEGDALVVELGLVRRARRALQDGDPATALSLLDAHARAFADGQMVEDRLALRVEALCAVGAERQARGEASRLRRDFPQSAHVLDDGALCRKK